MPILCFYLCAAETTRTWCLPVRAAAEFLPFLCIAEFPIVVFQLPVHGPLSRLYLSHGVTHNVHATLEISNIIYLWLFLSFFLLNMSSWYYMQSTFLSFTHSLIWITLGWLIAWYQVIKKHYQRELYIQLIYITAGGGELLNCTEYIVSTKY